MRKIDIHFFAALRAQIATLTAQVEELADRVGGWEERQEEAEEAVHKALGIRANSNSKDPA